VKLFGIGEDRSGGISAFMEYLKQSTRRPVPDIPFLRQVLPVMLAIWLVTLAVSAVCIFAGIGYFELLQRIFKASL
jgi:hypothetical protein